MSAPPQELLLGRIAVQIKLITMDQLVEATMQQGREPTKRLGDILVEQGWISAAQLQQLVQAQRQLQARHQQKAAAGAKAVAAGPAPAAVTHRRPAPAAEAPVPVALAPVQDWGGQLSSGASARAATGAAVAVAEPPQARLAPSPAPGSDPAAALAQPAISPPAVHEARAEAASPAVARARESKQLDALLARGVQAGASDIHIHCGALIKMRVHGQLQDAGPAVLDKAAAGALLLGGLTPEQRHEFEQKGELDFSYTLAGIGRFRANIYRQLRGVDATFRSIPASPPTLQGLGLPTSLAKLTNFHQGMVLITGPAGCGKSTTLASLLNIINEERQDHIITIEDPIEYVHPSKRCLVNQRQVGKDTGSFARALRAALREDPDVIAIGELRDLETISLAITAAETGHLVLATLHTNSAVRTVNRVLGVFPPDQQSQIRVMVSESLRAIISQRLLPTADGKNRVAALEVLVCNKAVSNLIREDKTFQIRSVLQTGTAQGMCLLDGSLAALVKSGAISKEEALRNCEDPKRFGG